MTGAIVGTEAHLGVSTIVNYGSVVDHHATLEDFGHLQHNVFASGGIAEIYLANKSSFPH